MRLILLAILALSLTAYSAFAKNWDKEAAAAGDARPAALDVYSP